MARTFFYLSAKRPRRPNHRQARRTRPNSTGCLSDRRGCESIPSDGSKRGSGRASRVSKESRALTSAVGEPDILEVAEGGGGKAAPNRAGAGVGTNGALSRQ
jgi:hypothetical protein